MPDPDLLERTHDEVARLWERHPDVGTADRRRFESGLIEVVGNVVQHGYAGRPGPLLVELDVTAAALDAVVWDNGLAPSIDLAQVTMPDPLAESGRGLALALASVDALTHERVHDRNRWSLHCDRAGT
jgi:serine/threonine-protein kinase RsbW